MKISYGCLAVMITLATCAAAAERASPKRIGRWNIRAAARVQPAPDQREMAVALDSGEVQVWSLTGTEPRLKLAGKNVQDLAWSPDGKWLAWGQGDGSVVLVDRLSGAQKTILPASNLPISGVLFLLDRVTLACGQGTRLKLIDLATGEMYRDLDLQDQIRRLEYGRDVEIVVALTAKNGFTLYDVTQQKIELTQSRACDHIAYARYTGGTRMDFLIPGKRAKWYLKGLGDIEEHYPLENLGGDKALLATAAHGDCVAVINGGSVRLLDTDEYSDLFELQTEMPRIVLAQFNPSGTLLALAGTTELQIWSIPASHSLPAVVKGRRGGIKFIKRSNTLVCLGDSITAWDWQTRACVAALPKCGDVTAFSDQGTRLAVSSGEFTDLWDLENFRPIARLTREDTVLPLELQRGKFPRPAKEDPLTPAVRSDLHPRALAMSPDGKTLAIARANGSLETWQVEPLRKVATWIKPAADFRERQAFLELDYSPDGRSLAGLYSSNFAKFKLNVFSVAGAKKTAEFSGEAAGPTWFCWSPDSESLLTTVRRDNPNGEECLIRVAADTGLESDQLLPRVSTWCGAVFGSVLAGNHGDHLAVWDLETRKNLILDSRRYGTSLTGGFALAPDGETLAAGGFSGVEFFKVPRIRASLATARAAEKKWKAQSPANGVAWLSNQQFVSVQETGQVLWWNVANKDSEATRTRADKLNCAVLTPDHNHLIVAGTRNDRGWLEILDAGSRRPVTDHAIEHTSIVSLSVAPNGKTLAWGTAEGQLALWDLQGKTIRWSEQIADQEAWCLEFHPDGKRVAVDGLTKSGSPAVVLREAESGEIAETINLPRRTTVTALAWSPAGKLLAIGSSQGLQLFDTTTKKSSQPKTFIKSISRLVWLNEDELMIATVDKQLHRLDLRSGQSLLFANNLSGWQSLAVAPARQQLLTLDFESNIQLRELTPQPSTAPQPPAPAVRPAGSVGR